MRVFLGISGSFSRSAEGYFGGVSRVPLRHYDWVAADILDVVMTETSAGHPR